MVWMVPLGVGYSPERFRLKPFMAAIPVNTGGYEVVAVRPHQPFITLPGWTESVFFSAVEHVLVPRNPDAPVRWYEPTTVPLARALYDLPNTTDAVLGFANQYGLLAPEADFTEAGIPGEPMALWSLQKQAIFRVTTAYESLRSKGRGFGGALLIPEEQQRKAAALDEKSAARVKVEALAQTLRTEVSEKLAEHVRASVTVQYASTVPRFVFDHQPTSLIGAIWLQCAWMLTGKRDFDSRRCAFCNSYLDPLFREGSDDSAGIRKNRQKKRLRSHARHCSDLCRTRHYNKDKKAGIHLLRAGVPLSDIADRLERDEAEVAKMVRGSALIRTAS